MYLTGTQQGTDALTEQVGRPLYLGHFHSFHEAREGLLCGGMSLHREKKGQKAGERKAYMRKTT